MFYSIRLGVVCIAMFTSLCTTQVWGATAAELNANADAALVSFQERVKGSASVLKTAKGVLVFRSVVKAGLGVGGEYGEGVLRVGGTTVDYYNTAWASFGLQIGVQEKTIILAFMDEGALNGFRDSKGWQVGVDGSVALIQVGAGGEIHWE